LAPERSASRTVAGSTSPVTVGNNPLGVAAGDFNNNGKIDIVVLNSATIDNILNGNVRVDPHGNNRDGPVPSIGLPDAVNPPAPLPFRMLVVLSPLFSYNDIDLAIVVEVTRSHTQWIVATVTGEVLLLPSAGRTFRPPRPGYAQQQVAVACIED